jgi:hypothetical protein
MDVIKKIEGLNKKIKKIFLVSSEYHIYMQTRFSFFSKTYKKIFNDFHMLNCEHDLSEKKEEKIKSIDQKYEGVRIISLEETWQIKLLNLMMRIAKKIWKIQKLKVNKKQNLILRKNSLLKCGKF